jgi:holliday junction DNA helicase RuvB
MGGNYFIFLIVGSITLTIIRSIIESRKFNREVIEPQRREAAEYLQNHLEDLAREKKEQESREREKKARVIVPSTNFEVMPHLLLFGLPGLGKTTFVEVVHNEIQKKYGRKIKLVQRVAGQLTTSSDIERLVSEIEYGDFVFIDEIASLRVRTEELLYSVLQDFLYYPTDDSILLGEDRSLILSQKATDVYKVPRCTFCGATTAAGKITQPLRDRFPINIELERMSAADLARVVALRNGVKSEKSFTNYIGQPTAKAIVQMHIEGLGAKISGITPDAAGIIAERSLGITRLANDYRFHAEARAKQLNNPMVNPEHAGYALDILGIDSNGTTPLDRRIINYLIQRNNKPVGINALASVAGCSKDDVENMVLPRLVSADILTKDHRNWNILTDKAIGDYTPERYAI